MERGKSMSGNLKSQLSKKNKYYLPKYRTLELTNFCLQYPEWKRICSGVDELYFQNSNLDKILSKSNTLLDRTADMAISHIRYSNWIKLLEETAYRTDESLCNYILLSVTEGVKYETLKARLNIPCGRDMFYDRRRKFFWLLDKER